jgi:hypothetical protein
MKKLLILLFFVQLVKVESQIYPGIGIHDVDSCNFDTTCSNIYIDTSSSNLWEIGNPHKIIFNSSISEDKVIITDTSLNYPINSNSNFILRTKYNYAYHDIIICFRHRYDTDTLVDGGYIEVSVDNGINWNNVIEPNMPFFYMNFLSENFYSFGDSLTNNQFGFSGYSSDWIESKFQIIFSHPIRQELDTILFRFNFISDSIDNNKEGWIIDDFKIQYAEFMGGVEDKNLKKTYSICPNPNDGSFTIQLNESAVFQELKLLDELGRTVKVLNPKSKNLQLNLPKGLYFLEFTSDKLRFLEKMVVN